MTKQAKTVETFQVTTVHCIAGRDREVTQVSLPQGWAADRKTAGKALRDAGLLCVGQQVSAMRYTTENGPLSWHVFPGKVPGLSSSITHSITLHRSLGCFPMPE
jgi:hypothetical protein